MYIRKVHLFFVGRGLLDLLKCLGKARLHFSQIIGITEQFDERDFLQGDLYVREVVCFEGVTKFHEPWLFVHFRKQGIQEPHERGLEGLALL